MFLQHGLDFSERSPEIRAALFSPGDNKFPEAKLPLEAGRAGLVPALPYLLL